MEKLILFAMLSYKQRLAFHGVAVVVLIKLLLLTRSNLSGLPAYSLALVVNIATKLSDTFLGLDWSPMSYSSLGVTK